MGPLLAGNDTFSRRLGFYLCNSREVANVEGGKRFRVTRIRGSGGSQGSGGAHRRAQVRAALVSPSAFTLGPRAAQQTSSATTTVTSVTSVTSEPDATPVSTHVLTTEAVRWGIDTLGALSGCTRRSSCTSTSACSNGPGHLAMRVSHVGPTAGPDFEVPGTSG